MREGPVYIKDLPIHSIPIVKENHDLMALADWLMGPEERCAVVECGQVDT